MAKVVIVADRSAPGPGCFWRTYIPLEKGPFAHKEGSCFDTEQQAKDYAAEMGYETETHW